MEFANKFKTYASTVAKATSLKGLFHRQEQVRTTEDPASIMSFIGEIRASYPAESAAALPHDDPFTQEATENLMATAEPVQPLDSSFAPAHQESSILELGRDEGAILDDDDVLELG